MKFVSKFEKITYIGMWVCYSLMIVSFVFLGINGSVWNLDWLELFLKIMLIISIVSLCCCLGLHTGYTSNGTEKELAKMKTLLAYLDYKTKKDEYIKYDEKENVFIVEDITKQHLVEKIEDFEFKVWFTLEEKHNEKEAIKFINENLPKISGEVRAFLSVHKCMKQKKKNGSQIIWEKKK